MNEQISLFGRPDLVLPQRFEVLSSEARESDLAQIVRPVPVAQDRIDTAARTIRSIKSGQLLVFLGPTGTGKTTFLSTLQLFFRKVSVHVVPRTIRSSDLEAYVYDASKLREDEEINIFVLEKRESPEDLDKNDLDSFVDRINDICRSDVGKRSLFVWPCNKASAADTICASADRAGGTALLPEDCRPFQFPGPQKSDFSAIAKDTVSIVNDNAQLIDFGIDDLLLSELIRKSQTVGELLSKLQSHWIATKLRASKVLTIQKRPRVWILVASASDQSRSIVSTLTLGDRNRVDVERLLSATESNDANFLRKQIRKSGELATFLDFRIIWIPMTSWLAIVRHHASTEAVDRLTKTGFTMTRSGKSGTEHLQSSQLWALLHEDKVAARLSRGRRATEGPRAQFQKLCDHARNRDTELNQSLVACLEQLNFTGPMFTEKTFSEQYSLRPDVVISRENYEWFLEVYWRFDAGQGDLAAYAATKLRNYGAFFKYWD